MRQGDTAPSGGGGKAASPPLPTRLLRKQRKVRRRFWPKIRANLVRLPFAEKILAAYFCAMDPQTPPQVKAALLSALIYFITPTDAIPDFIAGFGFSDDFAVLAGVLSLIHAHLMPRHFEESRTVLRKLRHDQA